MARGHCFGPWIDDVTKNGISVAPGVRVPYPEPTAPSATAMGKGNRRSGTKPEMALRSELHRLGLRFRVNYRIDTARRPVRVDLAFTKVRLAVLVDGCFWHGCPEHQRVPASNVDYWVPKLRANHDRDAEVNVLLQSAAWSVVRIWEHESTTAGADRVERLYRQLKAGLTDYQQAKRTLA